MDTTPIRPPAWALATLLLASAMASQAATHTSSVLITSFSATPSAGTLTWSDPYQSFSAQAVNAGGLLGADSDVFEVEDYDFAIAGASTSTSIAAISTTAAQTFWATASSSTSNGLPSYLPNQAASTIVQSGSFVLSQAGTVTFQIGYTLGVSAPGGNAVSDYGSASISFDLGGTGTGPGGGLLSDSLASFAQPSGVASRSGTFSLTLALAPGDTGFYALQGGALAFATAAVPEPGTWLLLGAGLSALLLRRRTFQS